MPLVLSVESVTKGNARQAVFGQNVPRGTKSHTPWEIWSLSAGTTRRVWLIGRFAVKFPKVCLCGRCYPSCIGWFFTGVAANLIEAGRWRRADPPQRAKMARVVWCAPLGAAIVMERCAPVTQGELDAAGIGAYLSGISRETGPTNVMRTADGRLVSIDYAYW